jgi:hypothetical protein
MNSEDKKALIWQVACLEVWPAECEPPLARGINGEVAVGNETKFNLFHAELSKLTDAQWTYDNLLAIVARLRTLPHDDLPVLRNIRTQADIKRLINDPPLLKRLAHLRPESPANKEINERMAFIRKHNLRGPETTSTSSKATTVPSDDNGKAYAIARSNVQALTHRDVGSIGSGPGMGAWDKLAAFKTKMTNVIDLNEKRGTAGAALLKHVDAQIADFRSASIR